MKFNLKEIRRLLKDSFTKDEFDNLVFYNFDNVYGQFANGQTQDERIRLLLNHAQKHEKIPQLIEAIWDDRSDLDPKLKDKLIKREKDLPNNEEEQRSAVSKQADTIQTPLSLKVSQSLTKNVSQPKIILSEYTNFESELLIEKMRFSRYDIQVTIHDNFDLNIDKYIASEFRIHNERRQHKGLHKHFAATRFRLICPPKIDGNKLKLDVARINFAYFALLVDPDIENPDHLKVYIDKKVDDIMTDLPQELKSEHKCINKYNYIPLGIEIVLVTNDGKTLLRRRGQSVATARNEWDVSFSGYCGSGDFDSTRLQVWLTADNELTNELDDTIPRNPSNIFFTTLHRNTRTGATDLLGYWKVEISSEELANLLTDKYPKKRTTVFRTTKEAREPFVWYTHNLIVDFDGNKIAAALQKVKFDAFMPEAKAAIDLALQMFGKPRLNL